MKKNNIKKIAFVILVSLGFQTVLPGVVYATGWPVVDPLNGGINTLTASQSTLTASQQILKTLKDYGLDTIAYSLAQKLGAKMANKLVNKANGGASGDSSQASFITNFSDYFSDSDRQKIDKFVTDLSISNNPYANNIAKSIIKSTQSMSTGKSALESFGLDKVVGADWKNFSTNANAGGWDGILALSDTVNTSVGAQIIAKKELEQAKSYAAEIEKIKLTASGTKPQGKCSLKWEDYKAETLKIKEGRSNYQFAQQAAQQGATNDDGTAITDAQLRKLQNDNISAATGLAENYSGCLQEAINNPVGLVSQGIGEATGYALKQTQQVQGWGQIIAGIFVSMFGSFVQSGLSSLSGDFNSSRNKNIGGPEQLLTKNGQQVSYTKVPTTIVNMPETFPESTSLTETEVASLKKYLSLLGGDDGSSNAIIPTIRELDRCIPGPDYDYADRLDKYVSSKTSRLTRKQISGKNETKQEARADAAAEVENSIDEAKSKLELAIVDPRLNIPGATIMKQEVDKLKNYRQKYQEKKDALLEKQSALNSLYKLENDLIFQIGTLSAYIPGIPTNLPFTNRAYLQLNSTNATAPLITWAKRIKKIPTNNTEWDALSATDKNGAFAWAKSIEGTSLTAEIWTNNIPTSIAEWNLLSDTDKDDAFAWAKLKATTSLTYASSDQLKRDFVLSVSKPIDQRNRDFVLTVPKTFDQKKTFVIGTAWDVWTFPERYMSEAKSAEWNAVNPSSGTSPATDFLDKKNITRGEFNSMSDKISIRRTIDTAAFDVTDLENSIDRVSDMLHDCRLLKTSITNFNPQPGRQNHTSLKNYLISIKNSFKVKEIQTSITGGISMITSTVAPSVAGIVCDDAGSNCMLISGNSGVNGGTYTNVRDLPITCPTGYESTQDTYDAGIRSVRCVDQANTSQFMQATFVDMPNSSNPTYFTMQMVDGNTQSLDKICVSTACVGMANTTAIRGLNYPVVITQQPSSPLPQDTQTTDNNLQQQPPKDVWDVIKQDNRGSLFCFFNWRLITYVDYPNAGINAAREKQEIRCDQAGKWSVADVGDYIGYVFGDGL